MLTVHFQTPNPEAVMRIPVMKKMAHQYSTLKGVRGSGRTLTHTMDQVLKRLSLAQIEVCFYIGLLAVSLNCQSSYPVNE